MLRGENLDTEFEPAMAVYESAILHLRGDVGIQNKIRQIETGYHSSIFLINEVLTRYIQRIQTKRMTEAEFDQMEDEIINFHPI
jgi:hypothetical protein